jgi:hypothetical protein
VQELPISLPEPGIIFGMDAFGQFLAESMRSSGGLIEEH